MPITLSLPPVFQPIQRGISSSYSKYQNSSFHQRMQDVWEKIADVDDALPTAMVLRGTTTVTNGFANVVVGVGSLLGKVAPITSRIPTPLFGIVSIGVAPLACFSVFRAGYQLIIRNTFANKFEAFLELISHTGVVIRLGGTISLAVEALLPLTPALASLCTSASQVLPLVGGLLQSVYIFIRAFGWLRSHKMLKHLNERQQRQEYVPFAREIVKMNRWKVRSCFGVVDSKRLQKISQNLLHKYSIDQNQEGMERFTCCLQQRIKVKKGVDIFGMGSGVIYFVAVILFFGTMPTPLYPVGYVAVVFACVVACMDSCTGAVCTFIFWQQVKKIDPYYQPSRFNPLKKINWKKLTQIL